MLISQHAGSMLPAIKNRVPNLAGRTVANSLKTYLATRSYSTPGNPASPGGPIHPTDPRVGTVPPAVEHATAAHPAYPGTTAATGHPAHPSTTVTSGHPVSSGTTATAGHPIPPVGTAAAGHPVHPSATASSSAGNASAFNHAAPPAGPGQPVQLRSSPPPPPPTLKIKKRKSRAFQYGLLFGLLTGLGWGLYDNQSLLQNEDGKTIQPPTKCDPFPTSIDLDGTQFDILGVGVRTVSFLKFHVYALGIYVVHDQLAKLKTLKRQGVTYDKLMDPTTSIELMDRVLQSGYRFAVRITPVRNTDFNHLRDGFVRSIMNHPAYKELGASDAFGEGLRQLKQAFGRKLKVSKGDSVYMISQPDGSLKALYRPKNGPEEELGVVSDPDVTRVFFLQYLSGPSPNSPSARESVVKKLTTLSPDEL